jgi:hypothetical protein
MRLIGVLDYQLVQTELRQDRGEQRLVRLVQTQPNDPAVAACNGADFLDRDIAYPLAVTVKRAGNHPRPRNIGGDSEVEHQSKTLILCPCACGPWSALPRPERLGLTMK